METPPKIEEALQLLRKAGVNVAINTQALDVGERPQLFARLLPQVAPNAISEHEARDKARTDQEGDYQRVLLHGRVTLLRTLGRHLANTVKAANASATIAPYGLDVMHAARSQ
jgi:hypothetical protein